MIYWFTSFEFGQTTGSIIAQTTSDCYIPDLRLLILLLSENITNGIMIEYFKHYILNLTLLVSKVISELVYCLNCIDSKITGAGCRYSITTIKYE